MTNNIKTNKNTPTLRFPGFFGGWVEKKLGTLSDVRDGTHDSPKYHNKGYPLITSRNLKTDGSIDFDNVNLITLEDFIKVNKRSKVDIGDILFGMIGTIGNPVLIRHDNFAIKNVALIKGKQDLINKYLFQYLKSSYIDKKFYQKNAGGTQKFIALGLIRDLDIPTPSLPEQQKIADFLSSIDSWLDNLRSQKSALESYKKSVMQKIFSQEIRFKDENGNDYPEWEEKKIKDVFLVSAGSTKSDHISSVGKNIIVDMGGISSDGKLIANKATNYFEDYLSTNDLVMPKDDIGGGFIIGRVACIPENNKYICGDHIYKLSRKSGNIKFLYFAINSFSVARSLRKKANGTAQLGLGKSSVEDQLIPLPIESEQKKIACFLSLIDKSIDSNNNLITEAELWKKGLMQQMFV